MCDRCHRGHDPGDVLKERPVAEQRSVHHEGIEARTHLSEVGAVVLPSRAVRVEVTDGWLAMGTFFEADLRVASRDAELARDWLTRAREAPGSFV